MNLNLFRFPFIFNVNEVTLLFFNSSFALFW